MAGRVATAVLAAAAVAWLAAAPAAAQVTAPNNANCTADDASITCTWSQPASSPITQYRCTWHARGVVARSFVRRGARCTTSKVSKPCAPRDNGGRAHTAQHAGVYGCGVWVAGARRGGRDTLRACGDCAWGLYYWGPLGATSRQTLLCLPSATACHDGYQAVSTTLHSWRACGALIPLPQRAGARCVCAHARWW